MNQPREPIFNIPPVIVATIVALFVVHAVRTWILTDDQDVWFLTYFAFTPLRYEPSLLDGGLPGGLGAQVWSFFTYAFIHADWLHLGFNAVWFVAFGSPVARRLGPGRFLAFLAITAAAGAGMHLAFHVGEQALVIGASASVSGVMAGAVRFAFQPRGLIWGARDDMALQVPALPLLSIARDGRVLAFIAVWFGTNLWFGLYPIAGDGTQLIAWQAHVGGFLAGLLLFGLFDPVKPLVEKSPEL